MGDAAVSAANALASCAVTVDSLTGISLRPGGGVGVGVGDVAGAGVGVDGVGVESASPLEGGCGVCMRTKVTVTSWFLFP